MSSARAGDHRDFDSYGTTWQARLRLGPAIFRQPDFGRAWAECQTKPGSGRPACGGRCGHDSTQYLCPSHAASKGSLDFKKLPERFQIFKKFLSVIKGPNSTNSEKEMIQLGLLSTFRIGQPVNYFNTAQNAWVSGVIVGFNPDGSVNLDGQPGVPVENLTSLVSVPQVSRQDLDFQH